MEPTPQHPEPTTPGGRPRSRLVRRRAAGILVTAVLGALGSLPLVAAGPATPASASAVLPTMEVFGFNDSTQYFTVPPGVDQIHLTGWGGSGGAGGAGSGQYNVPGGLGAAVSLDAPVNPGDTLVVMVGGQGQNAGGGGDIGQQQTAGAGGNSSGSGENGGPGGNINAGVDGSAGGGGGGGTVVVDANTGTVLLVAGGGGGGGGGGELAGYNGGAGGDSGTSTSGTCDGTYGPGTDGSGQTGGTGGSCGNGNGPGGTSGSGETPDTGAGTGGGGGGGVSGGNGGSAGGSFGGGGGGGGAGISDWTSGTSSVQLGNAPTGNGQVVVDWSPTPPAGVLHTASFTTCCSPWSFTVPAGVTQLEINGSGASGGLGDNEGGDIAALGGLGADLDEVVPVDPGDKLAIYVGGGGGSGHTIGPDTPGGSGGMSWTDQSGGSGGGNNLITGGTGGGGGAATVVYDVTAGNAVLLDAGGGGGAGGDTGSGIAGQNGGPGGNAGTPLYSGNPADGDGYYGSGYTTAGYANGAGGAYDYPGDGPGGGGGASTDNSAGAGGGGGGGVVGGQGGQLCTGGSCTGTGGGGAAGTSSWGSSAAAVTVSNALSGGGSVTLSWYGPVSTTTSLTASPNPAVAGSKVTLSATVSSSGAPAGLKPTGTITFVDADTGEPIGFPVALSSTGTASTTTALPTGTDGVSAFYSGDSNFATSISSTVTETVVPALSVTTTSLPAGQVGTAYSQTVGATGGTPPYSWAVTSGSLPAGLSLSSATGAISGTPTAAGTSTFTVEATDSGSPAQQTSQQLSLTVNPIPLSVTGITPGAVAQGVKNLAVTVTGTGFVSGAALQASDPGLTFSSVEVKSPTTITAKLSAAAAAVSGAYNLGVTESTGSATCSGCLQVVADPTVGAPSPSTLAQGANAVPVTVEGTGFVGPVRVTFSGPGKGISAKVESVGADQIDLEVTVKSTTTAGSYSLKVTNGDGAKVGCTDCVSVVDGPVIESIAPLSVARGTSAGFTVDGTGFSPDATLQGPSGVTFSGITVNGTGTVLTATITVAAGARLAGGQAVTVLDGPLGHEGSTTVKALTIT